MNEYADCQNYGNNWINMHLVTNVKSVFMWHICRNTQQKHMYHLRSNHIRSHHINIALCLMTYMFSTALGNNRSKKLISTIDKINRIISNIPIHKNSVHLKHTNIHIYSIKPIKLIGCNCCLRFKWIAIDCIKSK